MGILVTGKTFFDKSLNAVFKYFFETVSTQNPTERTGFTVVINNRIEVFMHNSTNHLSSNNVQSCRDIYVSFFVYNYNNNILNMLKYWYFCVIKKIMKLKYENIQH